MSKTKSKKNFFAVFGGTLTGTATNASSISPSGSSSKLPEPNFWMYVLVFSHRETIQRIEKLQQVKPHLNIFFINGCQNISLLL